MMERHNPVFNRSLLWFMLALVISLAALRLAGPEQVAA
jgi:hypothetical protein